MKSMAHVMFSPQPGTNGEMGVLAPAVERRTLGQGLGSCKDRVSAWTTPALAATARPRENRLGGFQAEQASQLGP